MILYNDKGEYNLPEYDQIFPSACCKICIRPDNIQKCEKAFLKVWVFHYLGVCIFSTGCLC